MNNKGMEGISVGAIILAFVAVIVAVSLLTGGITEGVGTLTTKNVLVNESYTATIGTAQTLKGQAVSNVFVINDSSGTVVPSTNYTITNYVVSNGQLISTLTPKAGQSIWANGAKYNVTYTSEPFGYDTSVGGRAVTSMIIIFCALAIAVVTLVPVLRNGVIDFFG